MEKRTVGIVATVLTILLCGCPGLFALCWGAITVPATFMPNAQIDVFGSSDPNTAMMYGIGAFCLGVLAVAIPVVVGILTLRKPKTPPPAQFPSNPIPPAL